MDIKPYTDDYPPDTEFARLASHRSEMIYFGQGKAASSKTLPLISEGFGRCAGLVVHNLDTGEATGFHIDAYDMNSKQHGALETLQAQPGKKIGFFVRGAVSFDPHYIQGQVLPYFAPDIKIAGTVNIPQTEQAHWGMSYRPQTQELVVDARASKQCITLLPFIELAASKQKSADWADDIRLHENAPKGYKSK